MALNQDQFEILEAYLDGELSAVERAGVDRELGENPQLRKLMQELAATRNWVAALPRASAPADLVETFQGQLERDALLGEHPDQSSDVVLRISYWSQFTSVAAILLLASGLGLVIYKVLPDRKANSIAMYQRTTREEVEGIKKGPSSFGDELAENPVTERRKDSVERFRKEKDIAPKIDGTALESLKSDSTNAPMDAATAPKPAESAADPSMTKRIAGERAQVSIDEVRELQQRMARAGTEASKGDTADRKRDFNYDANQPTKNLTLDEAPVVLLVNAQFPQQAYQDVAEFLTQNKIVYVATPEVVNRGLALSRNDGELNRSQGNTIQLPSGNQVNSESAYAKQEDASSGFRRGGVGGGGGYGGNSTTNQAAGAGNSNGNFSGGNSYNLNNDRGAVVQSGAQVVQADGLVPARNGTQNSLTSNTTQPAAPDLNYGASNSSSGLNGLPAGNITLNNASGNTARSFGNATYRALLTNRQQADLNDYIAKRGNQWAERRVEPRVALAVEGLADATTAPAPADKSKLESFGTLEKKLGQMAIEQPLAKESTSRPYVANPAIPAPAPLASKDRQKMNSAEATPPGAPGNSPAKPIDIAMKSGEAKPNAAPASGLKQGLTTNPTDELHEVLIVVNDQPVILPTVLLGAATTQSATQPMPAGPATAPTTTISAPPGKRADDEK